MGLFGFGRKTPDEIRKNKLKKLIKHYKISEKSLNDFNVTRFRTPGQIFNDMKLIWQEMAPLITTASEVLEVYESTGRGLDFINSVSGTFLEWHHFFSSWEFKRSKGYKSAGPLEEHLGEIFYKMLASARSFSDWKSLFGALTRSGYGEVFQEIIEISRSNMLERIKSFSDAADLIGYELNPKYCHPGSSFPKNIYNLTVAAVTKKMLEYATTLEELSLAYLESEGTPNVELRQKVLSKIEKIRNEISEQNLKEANTTNSFESLRQLYKGVTKGNDQEILKIILEKCSDNFEALTFVHRHAPPGSALGQEVLKKIQNFHK